MNMKSSKTAAIAWLALGCMGAMGQTPTVESDHLEYLPGEAIRLSFGSGPGNRKDWIGIYPDGVVPGAQGATAWRYVDGTTSGTTGVTEGAVTFGSGLTFAGPWYAYLLLNDGYEVLAQVHFVVVDASAPVVRRDKATYAPGEAISMTFTNGPAAAKDWIGVYPEGVLPGTVSATVWRYTDGGTSGQTGVASGTVTFGSGLSKAGRYTAYLLANDGYEVLASEPFRVLAPVSAPPKLVSASPADGETNGFPTPSFSATLLPGSGQVLASGVTLSFDGASVVPAVETSTEQTVVRYSDEKLLAPGSAHAFRLVAENTSGLRVTNEFRFVVGSYSNVALPPPIVFESFDSVQEGNLPPGWKGRSYSDVTNPDLDLGNLDSATYGAWTVVNSDRFLGSFITYSNPENPASWQNDYKRVLNIGPRVVLDGKRLSRLATGGMLLGNSGYRNGRSQVLFVETPDFNLSGKRDVYLAFHALWEQNQDSIAATEYSTDGGASWLPVAYWLDPADILRTESGDVDVEATFGTERGDVARYTDESGAELGGTYGAFVAAPLTQALAGYVEPRINDDSTDGKRIEVRRLPAADNQSRVRVRFTHAGTDGWYFGVDNFGLYSIPASVPVLTATSVAGGIRLAWSGDAQGLVLEQRDDVATGAWTPVPGVAGNEVVVPATGTQRWFRLSTR